MKTMTENEFIELISSTDDWTIETASGDVVQENTVIDDELDGNGDYQQVSRTTRWVFACVEATHPSGVEIMWQEYAEWPDGHPEQFTTTLDHGADVLVITGVTVVDEDGDEIPRMDLREIFERHAAHEFTDIDWDAVLPEKEFENPDADDPADVEIIVERDGELDLKFRGELIAGVSSSSNNASSAYSGSPGRWATLSLKRTRGGKYVAARIGHTIWDGEYDRHEAEVCEDESAVIEFFGAGRLAKELYEAADIDATEAVA